MIDNDLFLFVNTILAVVCAAFAVVFLVLPLPHGEGLKHYRISLRTLSVAYLFLAVAEFFIIMVDNTIINVISIVFLTICFLQTLLFATSIINLLHPELITKKFVIINLLPITIANIIYWLSAAKYGNPMLSTFELVADNCTYPSVIIRFVVLIMALLQLLYFVRITNRELRYYDKKLDDCFSDTYRLHLPWVRVCYYISAGIGLYALLTSILTDPSVVVVFYPVSAFFYVCFGACYIQYPRTYVKIEGAFRSADDAVLESRVPFSKQSWGDLKHRVIEDRYYLQEGITIEDMAQYLKVGRTALSGFINREEKMNFNAWIRTLRIDEAKRIMEENPDLPLTVVALKVGYSESSNFSRQFKLVTGMRPSEWCQNMKK